MKAHIKILLIAGVALAAVLLAWTVNLVSGRQDRYCGASNYHCGRLPWGF
jgi:hypothetical protein